MTVTFGQRSKLFPLCLLLAGLAFAAIHFEIVSGSLRYLPQTVLVVAIIYMIAVGADWLVESATEIARHLGVSELVIGLTVVAFGTSAPEAAVSLTAGFQGKGDIAVANVVGSNVFNICFILGGVALAVKGGLVADRALVVRDAPVLLLGTVLLFFFVGGVPFADDPRLTGASDWFAPLNLRLERGEGIVLMLALVAYLYAMFLIFRAGMRKMKERRTSRMMAVAAGEIPEDDDLPEGSLWAPVPLLLVGFVVVVGGSHLLIGEAEIVNEEVTGFGALWFARMWGLSDHVVGVTIVAAGTSAPEFIISMVAALRGSYGVSAGNLIGSDIFNMFGVVGLVGIVLQEPLADPVTISPAVIPSVLSLSGVIVVTIVFLATGRGISRFEGLVLVLIGVGRWIMDFAALGPQ
jgi:cation:H+ antiporter